MHFRALGPLALALDGRPVDVRPGRQPLLLACLLAHANRVVRHEALGEALWPGSTADVRGALRPVVSRTRRCLDAEPGGRDRLISTPTGYELRVAPGELDVFTFETDLERARHLAARGQLEEAEQALAAALSVWRGPAYADFGDTALLQPETVRLDELRKVAVEDQVDVLLALGHDGDAAVRATSLVEDEPFRERRWAQLMLALYRCGRQAEALQAYRRARELLADELGLAPGPQLVALEQRVLRHDPLLDRVAGLPEPADDHARARRLLTLGEAQRRTGGPYRRTLLEAGRTGLRVGDASLVLEAALAGGRGTFSELGEVDHERIDLLEAALAVAGSDAERARLLAALAAERAYDADRGRARSTAAEALAHARRADDPAALVEVALQCASSAYGDPERQAERHAAVREAADLVRAADEPGHEFALAIAQAVCAVEVFDGPEVAVAHGRMNALAERLDEPMASWFAALASAWGALLCGEVASAQRLSARAFEISTEIGQRDAWLVHQIQIFHIAWHRGRPADMLAAAMRSASSGATADPRVAWASVLAGRTAAAQEMLQSAYASGFGSSAPTERLTDLCAWAATAAELSHRPAAEHLLDLLAPWSDRIAATGGVVYPCVGHHLGRLALVLGQDRRARAELDGAMDRHRRLQAPFFVRETRKARTGLRSRAVV